MLQHSKLKVAEFVKAHDKTSYAVFSLLDEAKGFVAKQDYALLKTA